MPAEPRHLFLARPTEAVREHLRMELDRLGLTRQLGRRLFAPTNWHQSLSDRFEDDTRVVEQLLNAGARISARAVRFRIDRVESQLGPEGVHWAFKPESTPTGFQSLLQNVASAVSSVTGRQQGGHTAHITVSYRATQHLTRMVAIQPIDWVLDEVLLVRGGGDPYRYEVVPGGAWQLQAARAEVAIEQGSLF